MAEFIIDEHLNGYIARFIKKRLFKNGLVYNHETRKFEPVKPDLSPAEYNIIYHECEKKLGVNPEKEGDISFVNRLIQKLQQMTEFKPDYIVQDESIDPKSIELLKHVLLKEDISETHLLSIGEGRFSVLSTNRSSIIAGDELLAITSPWKANNNAGFEFSVYRNNKLYIPDDLPKEILLEKNEKYQINYSFRTKPVKEIGFFESSEIYHLVDLNWDEIKGHDKKTPKSALSLSKAKMYVEHISKKVNGQTFSSEKDYDELLHYSRNLSISSYTLNKIIELKVVPVITIRDDLKDWPDNIPEHIRIRIIEIEKKRKEKKTRELKEEYEKALKNKITQEKFLFIFKRSGYFKKSALKDLKGISDQLVLLSKEGFLPEGWAESRKNDILNKTRIDKWYNIKKAVKLVFTLAVIIVGYILFMQTKDGLERYNTIAMEGDTLCINKDYKAAKEIYETAKNDFTPKITSFIAYFKTMSKNRAIELLIDNDIDEGIKKMEIYIRASGKFDKHIEELLFDLLELNETHPVLQEYFKLWKKGGNIPASLIPINPKK